MTRWTVSDMPPQHGRTAIVTGTGGLGFEVALALSSAGARVILSGRSAAKGADAIERIRHRVPHASIRFELLDLADLRSVADFAVRVAGDRDGVDLLVNNAGVMVPPRRTLTADGFELQFGTNYLGHFALTAHLLPLLSRGTDARVISLSSIAARQGQIDLTDLNAERDYKPMPVYAQSKLACLMFAFELQRRSDAAGWGITSIAAHPGIARTDLLHNGPGKTSIQGRVRSWLPFLFQSAQQGALPTLFAATAPKARAGGYYGPDGFAELRGYPGDAKVPEQGLDQAIAELLWDHSQRVSRVRFDAGPAVSARVIEVGVNAA